MATPPKLLDRPGLAKRLKIHPNTITGWLKLGLPALRVANTLRFDYAEVVAWMRARNASKMAAKAEVTGVGPNGQ